MVFPVCRFYEITVPLYNSHQAIQPGKAVTKMAYTITTQNGNSSKVRRDHNIRNPNYVKKEPHIDPNNPHEIWHDEKVGQAYMRLFGPSVSEYNARQTRSDRMIRNYHSVVRKSSRKHDVYEMVVQIGGKDNAPEESLGYKILREYTDGWSGRNPNLEVIGAYYHADEEGAPHVHIDYVPVAHGYTRGPSLQPGLTKALGEQGFFVSKEGTAQTQFIKRENNVLESICRYYGLDIVHPCIEEAKHLETSVYKKQQMAKDAEIAVKKAMEDLAAAIEQFNEIQADIQMHEKIRDDLEHKVCALREQVERMKSRNSSFRELSDKYERLRSHCDNYMSGGRSILELFDEKEKRQCRTEHAPVPDRS